MFQVACQLAAQFTWPTTTAARHHDGTCSCGIGTITIVNEDGWFVTAYHIFEGFQAAVQQTLDVKKHLQERLKIQGDKSLSKKARDKQLFALGKVSDKAVTDVSMWLGRDGLIAENVGGLKELDLAWGRLKGFDKSWVKTYPIFKNPTVNFDTGASLCKLGFPLYEITPTFDAAKNSFNLPATTFPLFPIEGIFTRNLDVQDAAGKSVGWMLETSSPGLKGQSGGPIFDSKGRIWALQCQTTHHNLGFKTAEKQYLHSGAGPHAKSLLSALSTAGISVQVSPD